MEKELKALSESSATKEDISRVRGEMKKLYDGLHVGKQDRRLECMYFVEEYIAGRIS